MSKETIAKWLDTPQESDYAAAESYLSLIYDNESVIELVTNLKQAQISHFNSKDIFRASGLSLLGVSNHHVNKDRQKIYARIVLSPLLLIRDKTNGKVIIADGYHRLCAIYAADEDAVIPCKIA
ncbi:hypothetical protein [Sulfurimonas sp.]|uniref:hypothetical protein n=1 Tax=Sulfurimonas sp. TaxID=2022749 RepID=UPI0025CFAEAF|nr:hypothetical protein [Sulfurimonas sp.]MDD5156627.1 hypothetical protein [Sulfurimonas sp.]